MSKSVPRAPEGSIDWVIKNMSDSKCKSLISDYIPKTKMFPHQERSFCASLFSNNLLFALDMGLGKTKLALDIISYRKQLDGQCRVLFIAPPAVVNHIAKQVEIHSNLNACVIESDLSPQKKMSAFIESDDDVIIVSNVWLSLSIAGAEVNGDKAFLDTLSQFDMLIIDEVHTIKSSKSKGFNRFIKYFSYIKYKYFLSGTPTGNSENGLWSIFRLLDGGETFGKTESHFLNKYFWSRPLKPNNPKLKYIKLYSLSKAHAQEFYDAFWNNTVRYQEIEANQLPGKTYNKIELLLSGKQLKDYKDCLNVDDPPIMDLRRITAGIDYPSGGIKGIVLSDILQKHCISDNQRVIIWHFLVDEGKLCEKICNELNIPFTSVRGDSKGKKDVLLDQWRRGDTKVLIASIQSLNAGIDLYEGNIAIYYGNIPSLIARVQSEKRIHRTGQTRDCTYYDLVCMHTVDQLILNSIENGRKRFTDLTGDKEIQISAQELKDVAKGLGE